MISVGHLHPGRKKVRHVEVKTPGPEVAGPAAGKGPSGDVPAVASRSVEIFNEG